ncbi:MAG TPA: glycosyltransferase family 39 protein [Acetivibrio thermocellus]|nr:glycosyltransferase family 39 protein [Acetivibrio thermocellus]
MVRKNRHNLILILIIIASLIVKIVLIVKYKNNLTLSSDDLNYVKSAVVLVKRGIYIFHNLNEPTVFVTPVYPFFLALVFKLFGTGFAGLQAARIIQAVISSVTILLVYLIAGKLFNKNVALLAAFLVAFYVPNIVTVGYMLTETLFTMLLCLLLYFSLLFAKKPKKTGFVFLGVLWAVATLCRPTIALYPIFLFVYLFWSERIKIVEMIKLGTVMFLAFVAVVSPWWIRNYREYGEFIPLAASSGNPLLQGTYVNYEQTPENVVYYKLGKNAFETNKTEVAVAKMRIKEEFKKDFWGYLKWYTIGKTNLFWRTVFYWKGFFNIPLSIVLYIHLFIVYTGFAGIVMLLFKGIGKYSLPVLVMLYFNATHCVYMAFDRYAFPMIPLLSIFSSFLILKVLSLMREKIRF